MNPDDVTAQDEKLSLRDRETIAAFLTALEAASNEKEVKKLCDDTLELIKNDALSRSRKTPKELNPNTASKICTRFRKAIADWQPGHLTGFSMPASEAEQKNGYAYRGRCHLAFNYLKFSPDFYNAAIAPTQQKRESRRAEREPITKAQIEQYLQTTDRLLDSHDWRELVTGIIAATGRRFGEGIKTGVFEPVSRYKLRFQGQLKQGQGDYEMPCLIDATRLTEALRRLRKMPEMAELSDQSLQEIASGKNKIVNRIVSEAFSFWPPLPASKGRTDNEGKGTRSTRTLRYAYAAIACYFFKPPRQDDLQFIKHQLGHSSDTAAFSYVAFLACDEAGYPLTTGIKIDELEQDATPMTRQRLSYKISPEDKQRLDELQQVWGLHSQQETLSKVLRLAELSLALGKDDAPNPDEAREKINEEIERKPHRTPTQMSAEERIDKTVRAIAHYNDLQAENQHRWYIATSIVSQVSGSRSDKIKVYFDTYSQQIDYFNDKYNLGKYHNRGRGKITDHPQVVSQIEAIMNNL
jgi:DnaJ-domain-containing protein 1